MGTRTSEQERMAAKVPSKNTGRDTTMPHAFINNSKVVVAPHDCEYCHFHDAQEPAQKEPN
jgi:hypothetical protein